MAQMQRKTGLQNLILLLECNRRGIPVQLGGIELFFDDGPFQPEGFQGFLVLGRSVPGCGIRMGDGTMNRYFVWSADLAQILNFYKPTVDWFAVPPWELGPPSLAVLKHRAIGPRTNSLDDFSF